MSTIERVQTGDRGEIVGAATTMPSLVQSLPRLGEYLDPADDRASQEWVDVMRSLHTIEALSSLQFIAISGAQGAGKTTLMKALYPAATEWLQPNVGRGEKLPVAIVEVAQRTTPVGLVTRLRGSTPVRDEVRLSEWEQITRGGDRSVLSIRLEVPTEQGFWQADNAADRRTCKRSPRRRRRHAGDARRNCAELAQQMGRPVRYGAGELRGFAERARGHSIAEAALAPSIPDQRRFKRWIQRDPLGLVLVVAPGTIPSSRRSTPSCRR